MKVQLTIKNGEKEYFSRAISTPCVIGRGKQCDVAILHPLISRQHCEIYDENRQIFVRDLGSLNGTFFNGARIGRGVNIEFGSSFTIGKLVFKIDEYVKTAESSSISGVVPGDWGESREDLRKRGFDALDDFEKIASEELGLAPEREASEEPEEALGLTPEVDESAPTPESVPQKPEPQVEQEEENVVDDDVIDLEKFLKGEL